MSIIQNAAFSVPSTIQRTRRGRECSAYVFTNGVYIGSMLDNPRTRAKSAIVCKLRFWLEEHLNSTMELSMSFLDAQGQQQSCILTFDHQAQANVTLSPVGPDHHIRSLKDLYLRFRVDNLIRSGIIQEVRITYQRQNVQQLGVSNLCSTSYVDKNTKVCVELFKQAFKSNQMTVIIDSKDSDVLSTAKAVLDRWPVERQRTPYYHYFLHAPAKAVSLDNVRSMREGRPRFTSDLVRKTFANIDEMCIRIGVGIKEQAELEAAEEEEEQEADTPGESQYSRGFIQSLSDPISNDEVYQSVVTIEGKMSRKFKPGAHLHINFESDKARIRDSDCWSAVMLQDELWSRGSHKAHVRLLRRQIRSDVDPRRFYFDATNIKAEELREEHTPADIEHLFKAAEKIDCFVSLEPTVNLPTKLAFESLRKLQSGRRIDKEDRISSANRIPVPSQHLEQWQGIMLMRNLDSLNPVNLLGDGIKYLQHLTDSDHRAIISYLQSVYPVSIIQGPPGTGKTTLLIEIVGALLKSQKSRNIHEPIMLTAVTNQAVDVMVEKMENLSRRDPEAKDLLVIRFHPKELEQEFLLEAVKAYKEHKARKMGVNRNIVTSGIVVDFGQPVRVNITDPRFVKTTHSLGYVALQVAGFPGLPPIHLTDKTRWMNVRDGILEFLKFGKPLEDIEEQLREDLLLAIAELFEYTLENADVVAATSAMMASETLNKTMTKSSLCIFDEAGLGTLSSFANCIAGHNIKHVLLAGDVKQLSPMVRGDGICSVELGRSVLKYFLDGRWPSVSLQLQRRAAAGVMYLSQELFYGGVVKDHPILSNPDRHPYTKPVQDALKKLFDKSDLTYCTACEVVGHARVNNNNSRFNLENATFVVNCIRQLLRCKAVPASMIGIVTPYRGQREIYEYMIGNEISLQSEDNSGYSWSSIKIGVVDSYQGSELPVIFVDLVVTIQPGFVANENRLNVAISRAKDANIIVGCSRTLEGRRKERIVELFELARKRGRAIEVKTGSALLKNGSSSGSK